MLDLPRQLNGSGQIKCLTKAQMSIAEHRTLSLLWATIQSPAEE